jgi:hypothetical protein
MAPDPRPHVLTAIHEPTFNLYVPDALECEDYPVTRTTEAREAFAVAWTCPHPLLVVVDYHMIQFTEFVSLFREYEHEMPRLEWVVFGYRHENLLTTAMRAFIAERTDEPVVWTFQLEELFAAVEHAALRLAHPRKEAVSGAL